ncbi:MAG TPA: TonB-dependent receptor [Bacteroidales bacterium]|nr:TonB-dependent receptor [Bacteroidales bacterium]
MPGKLRSIRPILTVFVLLLFSFPSRAQDLQQRITLSLKDVTVAAALEEIGKAARLEFSYNPAELPLGRVISLRAKNRKVEDILAEILTPAGVRYVRVENHVVLKPVEAKEPGPVNAPPASPVRRTLSGFLKDKGSGESLIGANIYVKGTTLGAMTNGYGFYSLTLPAGTYPVVFSYLGYREELRSVRLEQDLRMNVEMEESKVEIREVEVVASEENSEIRKAPLSEFRFSQKTLSRMPGFGGDLDVIRAMQAVPGIQTFGDGSALYYVRGGSSDQNLLLIDEVPIYNPSHLFGFFSAFSPDAVNSVQIFKGDFPARFGGRLSSVIDIKAREGNAKRFGFSGNIGPYASTLTFEGPLIREKASFILSGRVSTLNWLRNLDAFSHQFDFRFYDIDAKLNFRLNENNRIFFTAYGGSDLFSPYRSAEVNSLGISWNNLAGAVRWNHVFNSRLFSNTTVSYSRYGYTLNLPQEQNGNWNSVISNTTIKSDLAWYPAPAHTVRAGAEVTSHFSNPGNVTLENNAASPDAPTVSEYHSMEYVIYLSDDFRPGKRWNVRGGLRLPLWQDTGPAEVCYFDQNHQVIDTLHYGRGNTYFTACRPEPRLLVRYELNAHSSVKASYTRTAQFLQVLTNSASPFTSLEVWAPAGPNIKPQVADQITAGYYRDLAGGGFTLSGEVYWKWYHNRPDFRDHANLLYNTLIEGEIRTGKARSYGLELMVRKTTGRLTGWIGYTWSATRVETPGINNGKRYPASNDRPHDVCITLNWDDGRHWVLSGSWIYLSGGAITTPVGFYSLNGLRVPLYGDRNNGRLPDYHRLDLSATYRFNKPGNRYRHSLAITLYNAYGHENPFSVNFNKMMNDQGEFVVPSDLDGNYRIVPTTFSVAGIIPSINYQFTF